MAVQSVLVEIESSILVCSVAELVGGPVTVQDFLGHGRSHATMAFAVQGKCTDDPLVMHCVILVGKNRYRAIGGRPGNNLGPVHGATEVVFDRVKGWREDQVVVARADDVLPVLPIPGDFMLGEHCVDVERGACLERIRNDGPRCDTVVEKNQRPLGTCGFHSFTGNFNSFYGATNYQLARTIIISSNYYFTCFFRYDFTDIFYFFICKSKYGSHGGWI